MITGDVKHQRSTCLRPGCPNVARQISWYCSNSCYYAARLNTHVPDGTQAVNRPKKYSDLPIEERLAWCKLMDEVIAAMPLHEAREFWDLARAHKLAVDMNEEGY